jgi:hypothetical protein
MICALLLSGMLLTGPATVPAAIDTPGGPGRLVVRTAPESCLVVVDSLAPRRSPAMFDSLAPGQHVVVVTYPDPASWLAETVRETLLVAAGEVRTLALTLPVRIAALSIPSGAEVTVQDTIRGTSPCILPPGLPQGTAVHFSRAGFHPASIPLSSARNGILLAHLDAVPGQNGLDDAVLGTDSPRGGSSLPIYAAGGAALVGGIAAAYFKIRADGLDQEYGVSRDPATARERDRMDRVAAIGLVVSQVGMIALIALLVQE